MPASSVSYRMVSWNVNGIRAVEKKGFLNWIKTAKADIVCLQETKAQSDQLSDALLHPGGYESYWNSAIRKGYSGTAIYTKISPVMSMTSFSDDILDGEGRIILLEFKEFFLFNVYFPNGGSGEARLAYKMKFYAKFLGLVETFRKKKPIVFCGDINTAHCEIDLARPKANERTSGFLPKERKWIDEIIAAGYLDTFRLLYPDAKGRYSWWDLKSHARSRNIGWRLDYFFVSKELQKHISAADIRENVKGSDHCPVTLVLRF
jgi:exodeoxyribonuclease-3